MPLAKQSERYSRWSMLVLESGAIPRSATRSATLASVRLRVHPVGGGLASLAAGLTGDPRARVLEAALRMKRIGTPVPPSLSPNYFQSGGTISGEQGAKG
jgi:hypothetical protein